MRRYVVTYYRYVDGKTTHDAEFDNLHDAERWWDLLLTMDGVYRPVALISHPKG